MSKLRLLPMLPRYEPTSMDSTATKEFKRCPRAYFYRFVLGRTLPAGKMEAIFAWGNAIHKYLEILYETGDIAKATNEATLLYKAPTMDKFSFLTHERLIVNFAKLYKFYKAEQSAGTIKVVAVEAPWTLQFPDGKTVGGRFDQIITMNNMTWLRDWKTTTTRLDWFASNLKPNDQGIRYVYGASCLQYGMDENGYPKRLIEGTIFHAIQNMKSPTVECVLQAMPTQWNMTQIKQWVDEQIFIHRQMDACREEDIWPMHEVSCNFCNYRQVCKLPDEASMTMMLRNAYILKPWDHAKVKQEELND